VDKKLLIKIGLFIAFVVSAVIFFQLDLATALIVSCMLFMHEYGHVLAMKKCGVEVKGMYFIPLMGAVAVTEQSFKSRKNEFIIAIAGPVLGLVACVLAVLAYYLTGNSAFMAATFMMLLVNLFNLVPVNPLDGGRIVKSAFFSYGHELGIFALGGGIFLSMLAGFYLKSILLFLVAAFGVHELIIELRKKEALRSLEYTKYLVGKILSPRENTMAQSELAKIEQSYKAFDLLPMDKKFAAISIASYFGIIGLHIGAFLTLHYLDLVSIGLLAMKK
jgi:Zn-dependent protease